MEAEVKEDTINIWSRNQRFLQGRTLMKGAHQEDGGWGKRGLVSWRGKDHRKGMHQQAGGGGRSRQLLEISPTPSGEAETSCRHTAKVEGVEIPRPHDGQWSPITEKRTGRARGDTDTGGRGLGGPQTMGGWPGGPETTSTWKKEEEGQEGRRWHRHGRRRAGKAGDDTTQEEAGTAVETQCEEANKSPRVFWVDRRAESEICTRAQNWMRKNKDNRAWRCATPWVAVTESWSYGRQALPSANLKFMLRNKPFLTI